MEAGLDIIPVVTKIDLPMAERHFEVVVEQMVAGLGVRPEEVLRLSAKTGQGVLDVFPAIIERFRHPVRRGSGTFSSESRTQVPVPWLSGATPANPQPKNTTGVSSASAARS